MNGSDLVAHTHGDPKAGEEALRRLEGQLLGILNDPADVIGQAAVGVGDEPGPLKYHDLRLLVQPADAGSSGSTACHTAYNDNFHIIVPPFLHKRKFRLCFSRWYNPAAAKQQLPGGFLHH